MIKYYRKNDSKALKHYIGSLLSVFFQEKNILKFLKLKDKSIFVKDFFISTKVGPNTVQKKVMFQIKVCTKVGNSLFLTFVMIRKWTLFSVMMVNL